VVRFCIFVQNFVQFGQTVVKLWPKIYSPIWHPSTISDFEILAFADISFVIVHCQAYKILSKLKNYISQNYDNKSIFKTTFVCPSEFSECEICGIWPWLFLDCVSSDKILWKSDNLLWSYDWIGLCSVLRPIQLSIRYIWDGFYRSKDPTNSIKVLKENLQKKNQTTETTKCTYPYTIIDKKDTNIRNNKSPSLH